MSKGKHEHVSLQIAAERDVRRQEIELNHKGVLKMALRSTDAKFNIRSGDLEKKGLNWCTLSFFIVS